MARLGARARMLGAVLALASLGNGVMGSQILQTSGFTNCDTNASISVQKVNIQYNNDDQTVLFNVAGTSTTEQNVTAVLNVSAYGQQVYSNAFDPCDTKTFVQQLCPVPAGTFAAQGSQAIPEQYVNMIPSITFAIPDIDASATLQLRAKNSGEQVACVTSQVTNGKTASIPAVSYIAASVAGAALLVTGAAAIGAAVGGAAAGGTVGGVGTISPSFGEVFGWFQGMAMNGMHSVQYPQVYRSFAKNFGFSTGLIPWKSVQQSIDNFRAATGGNLTNDSVQFLQNATLVFPDGSTDNFDPSATAVKRAFDHFVYLATRNVDAREITTSVNATAPDASSDLPSSVRVAVHGIQGYVEELSIPSANTFMTVLLIVAIVIAIIVVSVLLVKVVLEFWALFGNFPKSLTGFRKHYWGSMARAITNLILLLYGVWVLYCIFQFTDGDSWAAKTLAAVTLVLFTAVLAFFSWKIWSTARRLRSKEGDIKGLYEDKNTWLKYSLFYESYRKDYWWIFVPTIVYMFAKGCILAGANGHGMVQTVAQLIVESLMFILLLWSRPYERRSGNVINIGIQVVRVLSVVCILVFVGEFGIAQTTQTVTGVVMIAVQSALTALLAILIAWNAIIACCKVNPHRKRRKEMEKLGRSMDGLTPLDAHKSLMRSRADSNENVGGALVPQSVPAPSKTTVSRRGSLPDGTEPADPYTNTIGVNQVRPWSGPDQSSENLVAGAAPFDLADRRQPTLPDLGGGRPGPAPEGYRQPSPANGASGASRAYAGPYGPYGPYRASPQRQY
ncbi:hypothetical protein P8C59_007180 [Phyllachora maydis]|uniref:ML-like domain-containing protein n=1 Tax=Phyllachora maydis TaxID=1825666 RepID=A0AAD9I907_9PEZI|nr:hypothetical protein P8C59_007180 [Phyllachora maydis]